MLQIRGVFEYFTPLILAKKSLKKPKRKSESVNRRTDNTMAKKEKDKRANNDPQNIHRKLLIE